MKQRSHPQKRAAAHDGPLAARANVGHRKLRQFGKARRIHRLTRLDHVDHVMPRARPLFGAGLARADLEVPVHLHAVRAHDLALVLLTQRDRERRFSRCGGADHDPERFFRAVHQRRPTLRSNSAQLRNVTTGRPWGQWPAKSASSRASSKALASLAVSASPARIEPWQAIVASAKSTASEKPRPPLRDTSANKSRNKRSALARCSSLGTA